MKPTTPPPTWLWSPRVRVTGPAGRCCGRARAVVGSRHLVVALDDVVQRDCRFLQSDSDPRGVHLQLVVGDCIVLSPAVQDPVHLTPGAASDPPIDAPWNLGPLTLLGLADRCLSSYVLNDAMMTSRLMREACVSEDIGSLGVAGPLVQGR